eukprot:SAG31_NODE_46238_length_255_cov_0.750000_1_plen_77_part_01
MYASVCYPNILDVPAICSVHYTGVTVGIMGMLSGFWPVAPLANYAVSLQLLVNVAYWDPTHQAEDYHCYFRCTLVDV